MLGKVSQIEKQLQSIDERKSKSLLKFVGLDWMVLQEVLPHIIARNINLVFESDTSDEPSLKLHKLIHFWPVSTSEEDSNICINSLKNVLRQEDFSQSTQDIYLVLVSWLEIGRDIRRKGDNAKIRTKNLYAELVKRLASGVVDLEAQIIESSLAIAEQRKTKI